MARRPSNDGIFAINLDTEQIGGLADSFDRLSRSQKTVVVVRALNRVGDMVYTRVIRDAADQTGAKQRRVRDVVEKKKAWASSGSVYRIVARDRTMPLRDFAARQVRKGVSAAPWNKRRIFGGTFIVASLDGHVFRRERGKVVTFSKGARKGKKGNPIVKMWGPAIPKEMVRGTTAANAMAMINDKLPERIAHETRVELEGLARRKGIKVT